MQKLLRYICENGFEHHVAANLSTVASSVHEATTRYDIHGVVGKETVYESCVSYHSGALEKTFSSSRELRSGEVFP